MLEDMCVHVGIPHELVARGGGAAGLAGGLAGRVEGGGGTGGDGVAWTEMNTLGDFR